MNWADALAAPTLLLLLIAVPGSGVLAAFGKRGVQAALVVLTVLLSVNLVIAGNVREFGEFGVGVSLAAVFFSCLPILFGWHIGDWMRERRSSPGMRH